jgi:hypothetical protein
MATIAEGDTTWTTYSTAQTGGCGTNFSTSLLVNPVFSPNTMHNIAEQNPQLRQDDRDTVILTFTSGNNTYSYFVEKQRWLIVSLDIVDNIMGDTTYSAGYYYADSGDIPVLQTIAMKNDTTLGQGGVRFKSIRLNLPLYAARRRVLSRKDVSFEVLPGRVIVSGDAFRRGGSVLAVRDGLGRLLFSRKLSRDERRVVWDGRSVSGEAVAAGTYVMELSVDGVKRFYPFALLR